MNFTVLIYRPKSYNYEVYIIFSIFSTYYSTYKNLSNSKNILRLHVVKKALPIQNEHIFTYAFHTFNLASFPVQVVISAIIRPIPRQNPPQV